MKLLRKALQNLPSLLTALIFAIAVWVFAVTQTDPTQTRAYPRPLDIEVIGLASELTIVNDIPQQVSLTLRAPASILNRLENDSNLIDVTLDLSGLESGVHNLTPQVNINLSPVEVVSLNPSSIFVNLDAIITRSLPIQVITLDNPAIGFEASVPELSEENVTIAGPQSLVDSVEEVVGEINIADATEDITRTVNLEALNADNVEVTGITLNPASIEVTVPINQRGGYRSVVVKINTTGQIAAGFRLTNIFAIPPTVTVYSEEPTLVEGLGGFIETAPINLNGAPVNGLVYCVFKERQRRLQEEVIRQPILTVHVHYGAAVGVGVGEGEGAVLGAPFSSTMVTSKVLGRMASTLISSCSRITSGASW